MRVRKPKIIIADDNHALLRQMVSLLSGEFDVVATAPDGRIALEKILQYRPDVVVLDLEMPFLNGMEVTRELRKLIPGPGVVICSVESDEEIVEAAQQAGALGYVFKTHMTKDLIKAVRSATSGESFISSI